MALSHGGYDFEAVTTHDDVVPSGGFELRDSRSKFFDVEGESEIQDSAGGRDLTCRFVLRQYDTAQLLRDAIDTINSKTNKLTGTLTITGNLAQTYDDCTFKGAVRQKIIKDAVDGKFLCELILTWRQHKKNIV